MIHPAEEGAEIPEGAFHLAREGKLPFRVNILPMLHGPPAVDPAIDSRAIGLQPALRADVLGQEVEGMPAVNRSGGKGMRELPGSRLLPEQEREALSPTKERLIELHLPLEKRELLGDLGPEERKRVSHCGLTHPAERDSLPHWNLLCPAPEERPEGAV